MINPYSKFWGFMLKSFKDILTFILHLSSVLVQCITSLTQAGTSQAENMEPLKSAYIKIMPECLFETDGFRMNWVNLIKENTVLLINKDLRSLPVMSQAPFPALWLGKSKGRGFPTIGSV